MKTLNIQDIINEALLDEAKNIILKESENKGMYQITCEGEPVEVCETEEDANKHLNIYKKKHPEKEFIIEKVSYNSTSEMIDKLDEMGEKFEGKENKDMKKFKAKNLAEAIMDAHEKGITKIKVGEESYDVKEMHKELEETEGECDECGYKMEKESDMSLDEKLTGNQHKIDTNKNGKIDAQDFKMLKSNKDDVTEGSERSMVTSIGEIALDKMTEERSPCNDFSNEFEFADNIIRGSVDGYLDSMEIDDTDIEDSLFDLVKDEYGDEIMGYYVQNCNEEDGDYGDEMNESKKKTLRLNESQLVNLIEKIVKKTKTIKESKDEEIEIYYVMDSKDNVKNISKKKSDAEKFLEKSLKHNGKIRTKTVLKKDYDNEKITTSNVKTYKLNESVPGLEVTKKAQSGSKKENDTYMKDVEKKLKDYSTFDGNDNPEFPKQIGKGEKMAVQNTEEQNDDLDINRGGSMLDLNYDYEPSEKFKERLKMALEGDPKMGNSQDSPNVIKSKTGENLSKVVDKKKKSIDGEKQISWGHSWMSPEEVISVNESKENKKHILEEELKRMKNIAGYDKKTQ